MSESRRPPADDALLALFSAELESQVSALRAWVSAGAPMPEGGVPGQVERALHAIKGAARVIDATTVGELAESSERCLARWGALPPALRRPATDVLGHAADFLQRLARAPSALDFASRHAAELKALIAALDTLAVVDSLGPDEAGPAHRGSGTPPSLADASFLELFRTELEQCVATLADGLITIEATAPTAAAWESWMRAAHSIKGAARVLHLDAIARLAHLFEEALIAVQAQRLLPTASDVDLLLQAIDSFRFAGQILAERVPGGRAQVESAARVMAERLSQLLRREREPVRPRSALPPPAAPARPAPPLAPRLSIPSVEFNREAVVELLNASAISAAPPARREPAPSPARTVSARPRAGAAPAQRSAPPPPARPPRPQPPQPRAEAAAPAPDRVLRVAIESVERLLGLAGESLVESRRMGAFSRGLQRMRRQQHALLDSLAALDRALEDSAAPHARELLTETRARARECGALLSGHGAELEQYVRRAEELGENLYREALKSRMRPFGDGARGLPRLSRDLARQLGKRARLEIVGESTEVDRDALDGLEGPLNHLLRNALDHGLEPPSERARRGKPETGLVCIEARHHAGMLSIAVSDDGRGLDCEAIRVRVLERGLSSAAHAPKLSAAELFEFLFLPGFSTATAVSEISGRGVGLDVVKTSIEALGGSVRVSSEAGQGCCFHLLLPVTRSVVRAVVAEVAGDYYAFPLLRIERIDKVAVSELRRLENRPYMQRDERPIALISARDIFGVSAAAEPQQQLNVIVVSDRTRRFGLTVDALRGEHDLVVRPLDARLGKVQDIAAAAVLDDGSPALIIDVDDVLRSIERRVQNPAIATLQAAASGASTSLPLARKRVLVVDDSIMVREAERQLLLQRGFEVDVAVDGMDGLNSLRRSNYDLVITDIDMPRMNGIELVRAIKQDAKLAQLPIVIVSYKDRQEDRLRGLEAGATYYLSKSSFHDDKLVEAVEDLIGAAL